MHEPDIQHGFEHLDEPEHFADDYDQLIASDSSAAIYSTFGSEFSNAQNPDAKNSGFRISGTNPDKPKSQPSSSRPRRSNCSTTTTTKPSSPKFKRSAQQYTDGSDQNRNHSRTPQLRIPILISLLLGLASLSTILFLFISSNNSRPAPISVTTTLRDRSGDH